MKAVLKHWKTTLCGIAIIVAKLFAAHGTISAGDLPLITAGIGLIASSDANTNDNGTDSNSK